LQSIPVRSVEIGAISDNVARRYNNFWI